MTPVYGPILGLLGGCRLRYPGGAEYAHLANGISVQAEHLGRFPGAHAVYHAGSSDAKIQFHLVHPSHFPWALGIALWKVTDGPVFKRLQPTFEPSTRYTLAPPFTGTGRKYMKAESPPLALARVPAGST